MIHRVYMSYLSWRCDRLWDLYWSAPPGSRKERRRYADYLATLHKLQKAMMRYAR